MKMLPCLLAALLFAASCKKSDDGGTVTKSNTWKLGATSYVVNNYAKASETLEAYDKTGNGVFFSFATYPTADGVYNVVGSAASLGPNDVSIVAFGSTSGTSYFASGAGGTKATIKVINNSFRLRISLPDTWVVKGGTDSLKLSAELGDL